MKSLVLTILLVRNTGLFINWTYMQNFFHYKGTKSFLFYLFYLFYMTSAVMAADKAGETRRPLPVVTVSNAYH
jgi:hypothetical protein